MMQKYFKFPVFLLSVLVFVSSCSSGAELDTLKPKGPTSRSIDALSDPVFLIAGIVFVIIFGGTALLWIRFRDDHSDDEFPEQVHGNFNLEILWTLIPTLILAGVAVFTLITLSEINDSDNNVMALSVDGQSVSWEPEVVVVGQQWWWEYRYYLDGLEGVDLSDARNLPPADIVTSTQMVIPTGEEIELKITSRDVIHSHWIPALNGKRDAVPGRVSPWKIEADEPGVYFGQCTEFCGLSHARMRMQVVAMEPDEFQEWVNQQSESANEPKTETEKRGLEIFESLCARCHVINGVNDQTSKGADLVSNAAPNLTHLMSRTTFAGGIFNMYEPNGSLNRTQFEAWLRNAPDEKPAYAEGRRGMPNMGLDESQIDDLIAYLETLGEKPKIEIISATEVE
tara:strand:- start:8041 stop:9231 length:1191 start_codon:yes stop_codon:yes gene_type:complete